MPELPEVETVVRRLQQVLPSKVIESVHVKKEKSFLGKSDALVGSKIVAVRRKAKLITIDLDDATSLLIHLKMTGQLIYVDRTTRLGGGHPTTDWIDALPSSHTRVWFSLGKNAHVFFNDQRIFGGVKHVSKEARQAEFLKYAPDVIEDSVTAEYLFSKTQKTRRPIKVVLLDSKIVSGLGNIYVCDALNLACIDPKRPAQDLSFEEVTTVLSTSKKVLNKGIALGGATIEHFRHVDGFSGGYQDEVVVYGREGLPCYTCGAKIIKEKIAGRGTYYCSVCQK